MIVVAIELKSCSFSCTHGILMFLYNFFKSWLVSVHKTFHHKLLQNCRKYGRTQFNCHIKYAIQYGTVCTCSNLELQCSCVCPLYNMLHNAICFRQLALPVLRKFKYKIHKIEQKIALSISTLSNNSMLHNKRYTFSSFTVDFFFITVHAHIIMSNKRCLINYCHILCLCGFFSSFVIMHQQFFPVWQSFSYELHKSGILSTFLQCMSDVIQINRNKPLTIKCWAWFRNVQISSRVLAIISIFSVSRAWSCSPGTTPDVSMAMSGSGDMISVVSLLSVPSPVESVSASGGLGLGVVSTILHKE